MAIPTRRRPLTALLLACGLALVPAACGGDDDGGSAKTGGATKSDKPGGLGGLAEREEKEVADLQDVLRPACDAAFKVANEAHGEPFEINQAPKSCLDKDPNFEIKLELDKPIDIEGATSDCDLYADGKLPDTGYDTEKIETKLGNTGIFEFEAGFDAKAVNLSGCKDGLQYTVGVIGFDDVATNRKVAIDMVNAAAEAT